MKSNASTITIGEEYRYKKLKSLKPLFMPNIRTQILFQRTIDLYNDNKNSKKLDPFNGSIIIKNYKKPTNFNKSCLISKKNLNPFNQSIINPKYNKNKYKICRIFSENNINILDKKNSNNNNENKNIKRFRIISGNIGLSIRQLSISTDFKIKSKNLFNLKRFRLSNSKYWLNDSKNNNDNASTNDRKNMSNNKENNNLKLLNKNEKKDLKVKYYKWFI